MIGHKNARAGVDVEVRTQDAKVGSSIRVRLIYVISQRLSNGV